MISKPELPRVQFVDDDSEGAAVRQILRIVLLADIARAGAAPDARGLLVGRYGLRCDRVRIEVDVLGNGEWPAHHKRVALLFVDTPSPDHASALVVTLRPIFDALARCELCQRGPLRPDPDLEIPL